MDDFKELVERYRRAAVGSDQIGDPAQANKFHAEVHACYKVLRETEEGRERIVALLTDENRSVRCWAASHCLQWKPDIARQVLVSLRNSDGLCSFEAEMVLKEFDAGRLSFDY